MTKGITVTCRRCSSSFNLDEGACFKCQSENSDTLRQIRVGEPQSGVLEQSNQFFRVPNAGSQSLSRKKTFPLATAPLVILGVVCALIGTVILMSNLLNNQTRTSTRPEEIKSSTPLSPGNEPETIGHYEQRCGWHTTLGGGDQYGMDGNGHISELKEWGCQLVWIRGQ
jgi:hypothetical protein